MNRRLYLAAAVLAALITPAAADEYPDPLLCGHRITTAYMAGLDLSCFVQFGRKGHISKVECANKRQRIVGGRMGVNGMGEVSGTLDITDRKKPIKVEVRGYLSFTGSLTLAMQKRDDWMIYGLQGTAKIRPTCSSTSVFDEEAS